jgi:hypothetical protein
MVTTRRGRPHHPITTRRSRRYHSTVTIHRFLVTYGSQARILWPKSGVQGCRGSLGCSGRKVVVIMVDGTYRAGGRGVVGADGLTSSSASGSAQPRRSESADPHAEGAATKPAVQRWFRRERAEGRLRSDPHPSTHHRGRAGRGGRRAGEPDAGLWFRLVDRDRRVLALLAEHKVLTTTRSPRSSSCRCAVRRIGCDTCGSWGGVRVPRVLPARRDEPAPLRAGLPRRTVDRRAARGAPARAEGVHREPGTARAVAEAGSPARRERLLLLPGRPPPPRPATRGGPRR